MSSNGHHFDELKSDEFVEVVSPPVDENLYSELVSAVRYGFSAQVQRILAKRSDLINVIDKDGYSLVHWASKKDDAAILKLLCEHGADLSIRTKCEAKMLPIHWAASDGKVAILQFLLEHRQDINVHDANGCSPLIVATQHNQFAAIIFLIKNNADITQRDSNGDSALHWAAYKGLIEATALLAYYMPLEINRDDNFGQTPVHLAALQGHRDCLEYLISECRGDITVRDKNGATPLDLSIKKNMLSSEWLLRQHSSRSMLELLNGLGIQRLKTSKYWKYIFCAGNEKEASRWAWRVVFTSNLIGTILIVIFAIDEHLSDLYYLHQINTVVGCLWWIMFMMCLFKSPGLVTDNQSEGGRYSYETSLDIIARVGKSSEAADDDEPPNVCHTCRVRRPLRSKHCKILKRCVYKFDHFCPFVGNSLGRDNYKYFYGLLVMHSIVGVLWLVTVCYLARRTTISWTLTAFSVYSFFWMFMIGALLQYHTYLIATNLTTNENVNIARYSYLMDENHDFKNPFNKGSYLANIIDAIFPSEQVYYSKKSLRNIR